MCPVGRPLTLVPLLLRLDLDGEVLAGLPLDLGSLCVVVDEVTERSDLLLVEVGLGENLVLKELLGSVGELEEELEPGLAVAEVLYTNVDEVLESLLVTLGDELRDACMVCKSSEPESGNTLGTVCGLLCGDEGGLCGSLVILVVVVLVCIDLEASLDLLLGRFRSSLDDGSSSLVDRAVLFCKPLLELEDLPLELGLELCVLDLQAFETLYTLSDDRLEGLDVSRRLADESSELALDHLGQQRVLVGRSKTSRGRP